MSIIFFLDSNKNLETWISFLCSSLFSAGKNMEEPNFQFKCGFCEKSFFNEEILDLHIKAIHKAIIEGWKKCDFCDKAYRMKYSLYNHVKMAHSKSKSFECETCTKAFSEKSKLIRHKK